LGLLPAACCLLLGCREREREGRGSTRREEKDRWDTMETMADLHYNILKTEDSVAIKEVDICLPEIAYTAGLIQREIL
jgi:hypothetical protein